MDHRDPAPASMPTEPVPQAIVAVDDEPFFYPWSTTKLAVLSGLTFGFYLIWWFWTQWRAETPGDSRGSTLFKVIFSPVFVYAMAEQVKYKAQEREIGCRYSPAVLTGLVVALGIGIRVLPLAAGLLLTLLIGLPLVPIQRTINRISSGSAAQPRPGWRWWEIALAVVLGLFWLLQMAGILLGAAPPE